MSMYSKNDDGTLTVNPWDVKAGMTITLPEGLDEFGSDVIANAVVSALAKGLTDAGFAVDSLTVKGGPKSSTTTARYSSYDEGFAPEMDEDDNGAVLGA